MGEAAERVQHLSQQFGMTVGEVQKLQGVATATGIPIDALTKGMAFLDRNMASAEGGSKKLKATMGQVGVSFNDGKTQMEKLATVADKFKNMDDGPKKVALAMQLFGRSGKELIPILNLGSDGIEALNAKMSEYGVVNEEAVAKGVALAENVNETKLGFMGIGNVLTDALAPAFTALVQGVNDLIKAFIESYNSGGVVYVIFQTIAAVIEIVVAVVEGASHRFQSGVGRYRRCAH
jgi:TP901 family phage tail tape measure protein